MSAAVYFSQSYSEARERFTEAVHAAGYPTRAFVNPVGVGPHGETLATDVAYLGDPGASRLLILLSGTHGAEGFCGSGIQAGLLETGMLADLPADVGVLLIHAINPYGFAHLRRVNEDNVDLNRNSIDHDHPPATDPHFDALHPHLVPKAWDPATREQADAAIGAFIDKHGARVFQAVASAGQYTHADGIFYGGAKPVWSTTTFHDILRDYAQSRAVVAIIDFHTGLGPCGYGEPIYTGHDDDELRLARAWYGDEVTSIYAGNSASAIVLGPLINSMRATVPDAVLVPLALEFGTLPGMMVFDALRAEHVLINSGTVSSTEGQQIKRAFRDSLYVDTDAWKEQVFARGKELTARALMGLRDMKA